MAHWFGVELRNWRKTRGLSTSALGAKVQISGALIQRIEKAERSCNAELVVALDQALGAGGALQRLWRRVEEDADTKVGDADKTQTLHPSDVSKPDALGILEQHPFLASDRSPVERRQFLTAIGGVAAFSPLALAGAGADALPKVVRQDDIDQVWAASKLLAEWDNEFGGGGLVRSASLGLYHWATSLLDVTCPDHLQSELFTSVGRLAIVMGASAFDAYEHDEARHYLQVGASCAEHARNWHLRASALNWLARQAIWVGQPDEGLTYAENGLVRSDRLTPREQAMLFNACARAHAKMGHVQGTLSAVGRSDESVSHARAGEDVPWMGYYDLAQHHGDTGHALFDLALQTNDPPTPAGRRLQVRAAQRLQVAIKEHQAPYVRSRALSGTKLASLKMAIGDPQEAVVVGNRALDEVGRLRSKRAVEDVLELRRIAAPRSRSPEVAALRERIRTTVQA
ncbi:helix-turn-helix domain-containing protein (plasmid) [Streptomyces sp. NBC_00445]|uniref:helix-turn-helix transcriptional regulator n=1 Tax=Streptomyces sp. NBC_00445 TaxID=2975745 RepID=UPI002E1B3237